MTTQTRHRNERPPGCDGDPALLYTDREVAIALFWQCDGIRLGTALSQDIGRRKAEADAAESWKALADHVHRFADLDPWPVAQEKRRRRQVAASERTRQAAQSWPEERAQGDPATAVGC
jgi:hypothetical protein